MKVINPDFLSPAMVLGINITPGTKVYAPCAPDAPYTPIEGNWSSSSMDHYTKEKTDDKIFYTHYNINEFTECLYQINFKNGEVIPAIKETWKTDSAEGEMVIFTHGVKLGDPVLEIKGESFLDLTSNNLTDRFTYENPDNYQLLITAMVTFVNFKDENQEPEVENNPLEVLNIDGKIIFIYNNSQEAAHEQES